MLWLESIRLKAGGEHSRYKVSRIVTRLYTGSLTDNGRNFRVELILRCATGKQPIWIPLVYDRTDYGYGVLVIAFGLHHFKIYYLCGLIRLVQH